jgi:hypothetical protein
MSKLTLHAPSAVKANSNLNPFVCDKRNPNGSCLSRSKPKIYEQFITVLFQAYG